MLSRRYVGELITKHVQYMSIKSDAPRSGKKGKTEKNKAGECWKKKSNFFHNVQNFQQFGPVIRAKWMESSRADKGLSKRKLELNTSTLSKAEQSYKDTSRERSTKRKNFSTKK